MEPPSVPPLLPLPMLKLSPPLSTSFLSAFYHPPGSAVLCRGGDALCALLTDTDL